MTRALPAKYALSLAQPQPDAGERERSGWEAPAAKDLARGEEEEEEDGGG